MPAPRLTSKITVVNDTAHVELTRGYVATIDAEDVGSVSHLRWNAQVCRRRDGSVRVVYAVSSDRNSNGKQTTVQMHRIISGATEHTFVDHRDTDGLNNRKNNLRSATKAENNWNARTRLDNSSGFKGVSFDKRLGRWKAYICASTKVIYLGLHNTAEAAAAAYDRAAVEMFGGFALTNTKMKTA